MSGDSEEKTLPPSDQKLRKAREKGQTAHSNDFVQSLTTVVGIIYIIFNWQSLFNSFSGLFDMSVLSFQQNVAGVGFALFMTVIFEMMYTVAPFIILIVLVSVVANILDQQGIPFSLDPIKPDFNKINPGEGLKKLFKKRNITEFAVSFVKLSFWFILTAVFIYLFLQTILASLYCSLGCVIDTASSVGLLIIVTAVIMLLFAGLVDLPLQRFLFRDEQKMGHQEMKREMKDMLGSPEFRQHRRNEHHKAVNGDGAAPVSDGRGTGKISDGENGVTMFLRGGETAIGIYFHPVDADVPIVVSKVKGAALSKTINEAEKHNIPVIMDNALSVDIFRTVDNGRVIQERHFERVARMLVAIGAIG